MRGKINIGIFVFLLAVGSAFAGETKIELIPVYEKTFDEAIVDVIFDTVTVTIEEAKKMGWREDVFTWQDRNKGEVLVPYCNVIMVSHRQNLSHWNWETQRSSDYINKMGFYDRKGKLLKFIEIGKQIGERLYVSHQKKYILVSTIPYEFGVQESGGILYKSNGKEVWRKRGPHPIAVSDDGYTVAAYLDWQCPPETGGSFYIYDQSGKLVKTIENPNKDNVAPLFAEFTRDGEYAILAFGTTFKPPTIIYLIKKTGEILWKKSFPEYEFSARSEEMITLPNIGFVGIFDLKKRSSSGKMYKWEPYIFCLDWQGGLKWKALLEIRGNMIIKISEDRENIFVASGAGYLWCINLSNGKILWRHKEQWAPDPQTKRPWPLEVPLFCELKIINDTLYLVGKKGRNWHSSTLFIFDGESGTLLKKVEYPQERIFLVESMERVGLINMTKKRILFFTKEVSR